MGEQFQHKCLRQIHNEQWFLQHKKPTRKEINFHYRQPTVQTWLKNRAIAQHLQQTTTHWNIHSNGQTMTQMWEKQWQAQWKMRKEHNATETLNPEPKKYNEPIHISPTRREKRKNTHGETISQPKHTAR